jgi:hypothetical protein
MCLDNILLLSGRSYIPASVVRQGTASIPAPIPAIPRLRQYPLGNREENVLVPVNHGYLIPAGDSTETLTARSAGGRWRILDDLGGELLLEDAEDELMQVGRCRGCRRRADSA